MTTNFLFIILFIILFAILCAVNIKTAALVTIFALPSYLIRFSVFGIPMTLLEVMILLVFIGTVYAKKGKLRIPMHIFFLLLFLVAGVISIIIAPEYRAALGIFKAYIVEPLLFYIVIVNIFEKQDLKMICRILGASAIIIALIALVQYVGGWGIPYPWHDFPGRRAVSIYGYPNAVGLYLAPIASLFIGKVLLVKKDRWFSSVVVIFSFLAMIAARTEGAIIAIMIAFVFAGLFTRFRYYIILGFMLFGVVVYMIPTTRAIITFQDVSGDVRLALWQGTWNLLKDRPFTGAGLAGFPSVYAEYKLARHVELLEYPHNILLDFWVELGILGLIWIVITIITFFKRGINHLKIETKILMCAMIAFIIYGLVDVPYFKNDLSVLFWVLLAMMSLTTISSLDKSTKRG